MTWEQFVAEYEGKVLPRLAARSRPEVLTALAHFARIVRPLRVFAVSTADVDRFIAARRQEPGKKKGDLRVPGHGQQGPAPPPGGAQEGVKWGYLRQVPDFDFLRVVKKLPRHVTGEHFAAVYHACDAGRMPEGLPYPVAGPSGGGPCSSPPT